MYCRNCGAEINENAFVCPHCGALVNDQHLNQQTNGYQNNYNKNFEPVKQNHDYSVMAFIFSFFISIVGLILGSISWSWLNKINPSDFPEINVESHKKFALASIIISIVLMVLSTIISIVAYISLMDYLLY